MTKKNIILMVVTLILFTTTLVLINWYFVPSSRTGGLWVLVGTSLGYASLFLFGLLGAINVISQLSHKADKSNDFSFGDQIPAVEKLFTGRSQELQDLKREYFEKKVNVFGIHGMGGLGKTALAIVFANQIGQRFDYRLFIDMRGISDKPLSAKDAKYHIVRSLNPTFAFTPDDTLLNGAYQSVINKHKVLLLLDNLYDETFLNELMPSTGGALVFTTRKKFSLLHGYSKHLSTLINTEARELLMKIANRLNDKEADEINKLCGYLPGAILKAGNSLNEFPNISIGNYISKLSLANSKAGMIEGITYLSINLLDSSMKKHWSRLSIFPGSFGLEAASRILECDLKTCEDILHKLFQLSLINSEVVPTYYAKPIDDEKRFYLHDLDREYASSQLKEKERRHIELRFVEYYETVLMSISGMYHLGGTMLLLALDGFDKEWKNIEYAQLICRRFYKTSGAIARYCISICTVGLAIMETRVPPDVIVEWSEVALQVARRYRDSANEVKIMGNLGTALSNAGKLDESIPWLTKSLVLARAQNDKKGEADNLGNLGNVYRRKGELDKALEYHKDAYKISKEYHLVYSQQGDLNNIGNVYNQMMLPEKAREHFFLALDLARTHKNYVVEANVLYGIGMSYFQQFKFLSARKYLRLALTLADKIGATHVKEGILNNYSNMIGIILWVIREKVQRTRKK